MEIWNSLSIITKIHKKIRKFYTQNHIQVFIKAILDVVDLSYERIIILECKGTAHLIQKKLFVRYVSG